MDLVILEQMIPADHLLRKIGKTVDFGFIHELCVPLYCADNGRPTIDPEILFRMLFIGYLYRIKSEARLEKEVRTAGAGFEITILQKRYSMKFCDSVLHFVIQRHIHNVPGEQSALARV